MRAVHYLAASVQPWIECVPETVSERVEGENGESDHRGWRDEQLWLVDERPRRGDHVAPRWCWWLCAESEERKPAFHKNREPQAERKLDKDGGGHIWQDCLPHDVEAGRSDHPRRLDEFRIANRQG